MKKIILGTLLIIIILASVITYYYNYKLPLIKCDLPASFTYTLADKANCYYNVGKNKQRPGLCKNIQNSDYMAQCIKGTAVGAKDISICNKTEQKDSCIAQVAKELGDKSLCEQSEIDSSLCYSFFLEIPEECEKLTNSPISYKDSCYNDFAKKLQDTNLCRKIEHVTTKNKCVYGNAIDLQKTILCRLITLDPELQNEEDYSVERSIINCINDVKEEMRKE